MKQNKGKEKQEQEQQQQQQNANHKQATEEARNERMDVEKRMLTPRSAR